MSGPSWSRQRAANGTDSLFYDKFDLPDLAEPVVVQLRTQLRTILGLRKAYFVQKRVAYLSHRICYVLAFRVTGLFRIHSKKRAAEVLEKIRETVQFPGETIIVNVEGANYQLGMRFRGMKWSRIV